MDLLQEVAGPIKGTIQDETTAKKVLDRGHVLESTEKTIIVEVERHKAASGAKSGVKGSGGRKMNAYITYWPRYQYDRESGEVTSLKERRPREFSCGYGKLASELLHWEHFSLRVYREDQTWFCSETVGGAETSVENVEDVESFAESQLRGWDLEEIYGVEIPELLSEEELEEHFSKLEDALVEEARRQAEKAWQDRNRY